VRVPVRVFHGHKAEPAGTKELFPDSALLAILGTNVAAMHHMKLKIKGLYPIVAGLFVSLAVPAAGA